ncbi:MAG: hypothetical protein V3S39_03255, partial [Thermodesulfobacteriota bacterium]
MARKIIRLRKKSELGPLGLWDALKRQRRLRHTLGPGGIYRVLERAGLIRRHKRKPKRYRRTFLVPRPGDLLQVDVKYLPYLVEGRRFFQYTPI